MISFFIKLILLAVFNVSFFTITKAECTFSMWISYGFIHFAFLMFFLSPLFTKKSRNSRHVAIESIALVTAIYFVATLIVGLFFLLNPMLVLFQYSVEAFITGIYLIILLITIVVNNRIADNDNTADTEKQLLNNIYVKAEFLKTKSGDAQVITELNALQEDSRYSPTKSSPAVKEFENQIISNLDEVTRDVEKAASDEILSKIKNCRDLLKQRNLMLKKGM